MENEVFNEPDYVKELIRLIRSGTAGDALAAKLDNYHDNDISNALDELTAGERKILYHTLGDERVSEIFAYLDDPGKYLGELELNALRTSLRTWMQTTPSMCSRRLTRRPENS